MMHGSNQYIIGPEDREDPLGGREEVPCECCQGVGTIDERLGGEWNSNPAATCPDCHGEGWV